MTTGSSLQCLTEEWRTREAGFSHFVQGPLQTFWQTRQEWQFSGIDNVPIRCVKFTAPHHQRAVVIVSGYTENYTKYQEVIYDFFHQGYDVFMYDHRGHGLSGRMLKNSYKVYVQRFDDYVDDLENFWQQTVLAAPYQHRFILGHSMGGAISALFLTRHPEYVNAAVLNAPMIGINTRIPIWMARRIIQFAEQYRAMREGFVVQEPFALPFSANLLTHSRERYHHFHIEIYERNPELKLTGPTYHWVSESLQVTDRLIADAKQFTMPLLLFQAGKESLVSNPAQKRFYQTITDVGVLHPESEFRVFKSAYHEILFEVDDTRSSALEMIVDFFARY